MFEAEAGLFTRSGDRLHVRPVTADDRSRVIAFFKQLSEDDLRDRFLTTMNEVDATRIDQLCRADYPEAMSFLAFHEDELVALATLAGGADGKVEIALATLPNWKKRGVSWALFGHAINFACEKGARQIVSTERSGNRAAITLEHEMGFGIRLIDASTGETTATMAL
jgi:GNAT superfamily N-acetyltransferase